MAAAMAGDDDIARAIYNILQHHAKESLTAKYNLTFTFDGKEFSTFFKITEEEALTNDCITLTGFDSFDSSISANSSTKNCFTPNISDRANLPEGVTQTDILQVLSTKLKFTALPSKKSFVITDVASPINPYTGKKYATRLSQWRLLRGERTLYEKYGYTNLLLDKVREISQTTRWAEIRDQTIKGKPLSEIAESFLTTEGASIFVPEQTIAECMKQLSYTETDRVVIPNITPALPPLTIVSMIFNAFIGIGKLTKSEVGSLLNLKINRESELWKSWDARLRFQSFEPVMEGGRRRKTQRRRQTTHRRKLRYSRR